MKRMEKAFADKGYNVVVCNYASDRDVSAITTNLFESLEPYIAAAPEISFVTHSLGGIILRTAMSKGVPDNFGRAVLIAPPNHGSELIDGFSWIPFFKLMWGEPSLELGTGAGNAWTNLPPVNFPCGIIAGDGGIPPLSWFLPGRDDGKVTVESTRVSGVSDYKLLHAHHTYMPFNGEIISNTVFYIQNGSFPCGEIAAPENKEN